MIKKRLTHTGGQVLASFLAFLFLLYFAGSIFLFFLHKEGLFRFEFGAEDSAEKEMVFDRNRVLELVRKEKFLEQESERLDQEKKVLEDIQRQIEIEKGDLIRDKNYLTKKMEEISGKFKEFSDEEEASLQQLANLYAKMKAQRVAIIFQELKPETVANLLKRMQEKSSSKILGEIGIKDAKLAARISDIIEGKDKKSLFDEIE